MLLTDFIGKLLRTLSRDGKKRSLQRDINKQSASTGALNYKAINAAADSSGSLPNKATNSNRCSSVSSSSVSYDENLVDLGSCSDRGSNTRPNSIAKLKTDSSSSEFSFDEKAAYASVLPQVNGDHFSKVCSTKLCNILFSFPCLITPFPSSFHCSYGPTYLVPFCCGGMLALYFDII